jgi:hypothetical protein
VLLESGLVRTYTTPMVPGQEHFLLSHADPERYELGVLEAGMTLTVEPGLYFPRTT